MQGHGGEFSEVLGVGRQPNVEPLHQNKATVCPTLPATWGRVASLPKEAVRKTSFLSVSIFFRVVTG